MQIKTAQITTFSNHIITIENRSFTNTRLNYLATNLLIILDDKKTRKMLPWLLFAPCADIFGFIGHRGAREEAIGSSHVAQVSMVRLGVEYLIKQGHVRRIVSN